ncbi:MAG: SpoVR family protein [Acidobacteria bacterium]|nr:SpoVR family protein [Acidobacteriota bacterium]MBI3421806.1 SpoVR family protein [Acidobacteriota bacterium]
MDREVNELEKALAQIWDIAVNKFDLDPFPTKFEIVPASVMYEVGSYALPGRYSHWSFGKAYHRMKTMYDFGLSKIYEVVINSNPSYAFLLETNSLLQNKLVIAHVLGHVDFFKHNAYFAPTNRRMVDDAALHARRINEYEFKYGRKTVEDFLDAVLSIEEHIDPDFYIKKNRRQRDKDEEKEVQTPNHPVGAYDDLRTREERDAAERQAKDDALKESQQPEKDLIWYIMQHSPSLQPWQRDIMSMIHDEMLYFVPQMQTKVMNEGWASYWHSRIMRELDLPTEEHLEFAELHAGVVSPHRGQLNPYYLGYKIFEDIERRWDNPTAEEREKLGRQLGQGRAKMFEVRELDNDISFLRNYLTEELCEELDLFVYELVDEEEWTVTEKRWERVRDQLVANMTNFGFPYIVVTEGDYHRNRELYLTHQYEGSELDIRYARKVLEHVFKLWGRTVHLETRVEDEPRVFHYDGEEHSED